MVRTTPTGESPVFQPDPNWKVWENLGLAEHPGTKQVVQGQEVWRPTWTGAFDVFEADGTYRGSVALPEGARFRSHPAVLDPFIAGDTVWLLRFDSLDVPAVSKMLVEWEK